MRSQTGQLRKRAFAGGAFFEYGTLTQTPSPLLHGRKGGAFCHVDGIDSIFTREEAKAVAKAVAEAGGREAYVLAWEFEMDLRLTTVALESELGVKLKLIPIPREIMEKNRKSPPPFLEAAVLEAEPEGVAVDELELVAPLLAVPTLRGVPRVAPGTPLPSAAPIAIELDAGGAPTAAWCAPASSQLGARGFGIRRANAARTVEAVDD